MPDLLVARAIVPRTLGNHGNALPTVSNIADFAIPTSWALFLALLSWNVSLWNSFLLLQM